MKNLIQKLSHFIPSYVIIPLITVLSSQSLIYFGTKIITKGMSRHNLNTIIDKNIPIIPAFSIIYLGCYLFWALNYALAGRSGKNYFYNFVCNIFLGYLISGIIFCLFPTYIERPLLNSVPDVFGKSIMTFVYNSDTPVNLFPSLHCQISWYCYLGVHNQKSICKWYQYISLFFALLVCISTVAIKQHFFLDIIGGILIAQFSYYISMKCCLGKYLQPFFEMVNQKLHIS